MPAYVGLAGHVLRRKAKPTWLIPFNCSVSTCFFSIRSMSSRLSSPPARPWEQGFPGLPEAPRALPEAPCPEPPLPSSSWGHIRAHSPHYLIGLSPLELPARRAINICLEQNDVKGYRKLQSNVSAQPQDTTSAVARLDRPSQLSSSSWRALGLSEA